MIFIFTNEKNTYFYTRCPLHNSHSICIPKAHSNEVNFNICPHTNTKWKTRCKFAKIALRTGCFTLEKKLRRRFLVQPTDG